MAISPKTVVDTPLAGDTPAVVATDGGPQFVLDQMCDALERAAIDARGRTNDLSIRWAHGDDVEEGPRVFTVTRDGADDARGLSVDDAKALLDGMV